MTRYWELVPPPELREHVLCGWTLGPVAGDAPPVLPDGCMDIVWREGVGTIVAGPETAAARSFPFVWSGWLWVLTMCVTDSRCSRARSTNASGE